MFKPSLVIPTENPEPATPQPANHGSKRSWGKKFYVLAAAIIVVVLVCAFLFSNYSAATIPLSLNYEVGERMVYASSWQTTTERYNLTINIPATQTTNGNSTLTINILSLNGDTYTLNNTYNFDILGKPLNTNMTQQITKADYVNNFLVGDAARLLNMTGDKFDYYKLNLLQATIGESIQIPVNTGNESIGTTGTLNVKFASVEEITVPAGTFKVFRLDYTADFTIHANLQGGILNIQLPEPVPGQITGQTFLEYGTCRLIKSTVTETNQFTGQINYNATYTSERILTELIKP
ncbi:MAG: hypothetical protein ACFCUE_05225 [Candidatus Bathyarchaeia archaeon]|jgi:hypothetical protein